MHVVLVISVVGGVSINYDVVEVLYGTIATKGICIPKGMLTASREG